LIPEEGNLPNKWDRRGHGEAERALADKIQVM